MGQDHGCSIKKKGKNPICRGSDCNSAFPYFLGIGELFKVMSRNDFELLDNAQYPEHFLRLFGLKGVEKFLNRTSTLFGPIKDNNAFHRIKLTCKLTIVNKIVMSRIAESAISFLAISSLSLLSQACCELSAFSSLLFSRFPLFFLFSFSLFTLYAFRLSPHFQAIPRY
jgi:hypothetical protein